MQDLHDLKLILERKEPLIVIETYEEPRALELLTRLAIERGDALRQWTVSDGLRRLGFGEDVAVTETESPDKALRAVKQREESGLFVFCDLHPFLDQALIVRLIKDIVFQHEGFGKTIVLLSHQVTLPEDLQRYAVRFRLTLPGEEQLLSLVREEARHFSRTTGQKVKTDNTTLQQIVRNLRGVTYADARRLIRGAIVDDGAITQDDLGSVTKAKMALLDRDGAIHFEYDTARFMDVAGLDVMKQWLDKRRETFFADDPRMRPRGVMLFGVQGSGKSLAAKAVAGSWGVPLLRLDMGNMYNKYIGETERNLREALEMAETMSPCVVWMDEIEKGLGQDGSDSGVSQRLLGTLLTWLAEHKSSVFTVMTANNIHALPPELVRKGRLDELFFVDLPRVDVREAIIRLHLAKRQIADDTIDVAAVATASDGFSGAELEQVIVSACHRRGRSMQVAEKRLVTTEDLLDEVQRTCPLSVTMAEAVQDLRDWASGRAVLADSVH